MRIAANVNTFFFVRGFGWVGGASAATGVGVAVASDPVVPSGSTQSSGVSHTDSMVFALA